MRLSIIATILFIAVQAFAGTVDVIISLSDFTSAPQAVKRVAMTPLSSVGVVGNNIIFPITVNRQTGANGSVTVTNVSNLFSYRIALLDAAGLTLGQTTNFYGTNTTGAVSAANYISISTNLGNGIYAYSMAAADARFATNGSTGGGTTYTNSSTGMVGQVVGSSISTNTSYLMRTNTPVTLAQLPSGVVTTNLLADIEGLIVMPFTNQPASVTNNPRYFGPWLGADYVNQALAALPQYSDRTKVGGGTITVVGINYYPRTLRITNSLGGIYPVKLRALNFCGGALVCATNPAIVAGSIYTSSYAGTTVGLENLIVASLVNQCTNLVSIGASVDTAMFRHNWFGYWNYLTNNQNSTQLGVPSGLSTPTTDGQVLKRNLVLDFFGSADDMYIFEDNFVFGMAGLYWNPDHGAATHNSLYFSGGRAENNNTDWPSNSIYGQGAAIILGQNVNNNWTFNQNFFYGCGARYFAALHSDNVKSYGDYSESTGYNVVSCDGGYLIQHLAETAPENLAVHSPSGNTLAWIFPNLYKADLQPDTDTIPPQSFFSYSSTGLLLGSGMTLTADGSGLSNLPPTAIVGTAAILLDVVNSTNALGSLARLNTLPTAQLVASNIVTLAMTNLVTTNTAGVTRLGNNLFAISTNYDALGAATAVTNGLPAKVWTLGNLANSNSITSNNISGSINIGQVFGAPTTNGFITSANGGNAALATNLVANVTLTNPVINGGSFTGNGGGLTNLYTQMIFATTNIGGGTNSSPYTLTNSVMSFTLTGSSAAPAVYRLQGYINAKCTNAGAGIVAYLDYVGTDYGSGIYGRANGANNSLTSFPVDKSSGHIAELYNLTTEAMGTFDSIVITSQTNTYNWKLYQFSTLAADRPLLTTNSWILIQRLK